MYTHQHALQEQWLEDTPIGWWWKINIDMILRINSRDKLHGLLLISRGPWNFQYVGDDSHWLGFCIWNDMYPGFEMFWISSPHRSREHVKNREQQSCFFFSRSFFTLSHPTLSWIMYRSTITQWTIYDSWPDPNWFGSFPFPKKYRKEDQEIAYVKLSNRGVTQLDFLHSSSPLPPRFLRFSCWVLAQIGKNCAWASKSPSTRHRRYLVHLSSKKNSV